MLMIVIIISQWQKSANLASRCHGTPKISLFSAKSRRRRTRKFVSTTKHEGWEVSYRKTLHIDIDVILMLLEVVYSLVVASSSLSPSASHHARRRERRETSRKYSAENLNLNSHSRWILLVCFACSGTSFPIYLVCQPTHIPEIYSCPKNLFSSRFSISSGLVGSKNLNIYLFLPSPYLLFSAEDILPNIAKERCHKCCWKTHYSRCHSSSIDIGCCEEWSRTRCCGQVNFKFLMRAFLTCLKTFLFMGVKLFFPSFHSWLDGSTNCGGGKTFSWLRLEQNSEVRTSNFYSSDLCWLLGRKIAISHTSLSECDKIIHDRRAGDGKIWIFNFSLLSSFPFSAKFREKFFHFFCAFSAQTQFM